MWVSRIARTAFFVLLAVVSDGLGGESAKPKNRLVFNDDAQFLAEAPERGASAFIKAWLDRETAFVPCNTFVFLAAMPEMARLRTYCRSI